MALGIRDLAHDERADGSPRERLPPALRHDYVHQNGILRCLLSATRNPDSAWVTQQARNLFLEDRETPVRFLVHDRDQKFTRSFDGVFKTEGAEVILTPIRSPKVNAPCRAMGADGAGRVSGLDRRARPPTSRASPRHLRVPLERCRPHRGLGLTPPLAPPQDLLAVSPRDFRRRDLLGGLIHEY